MQWRSEHIKFTMMVQTLLQKYTIRNYNILSLVCFAISNAVHWWVHSSESMSTFYHNTINFNPVYIILSSCLHYRIHYCRQSCECVTWKAAAMMFLDTILSQKMVDNKIKIRCAVCRDGFRTHVGENWWSLFTLTQTSCQN